MPCTLMGVWLARKHAHVKAQETVRSGLEHFIASNVHLKKKVKKKEGGEREKKGMEEGKKGEREQRKGKRMERKTINK